MAVDRVVKVLDEISRPISTKEEVAQVGTISANGEREIGELLAEAMERVGKEGVITVQDGKTLQVCVFVCVCACVCVSLYLFSPLYHSH